MPHTHHGRDHASGLLKAVQHSDLPIKSLATHHFTLDQLGEAWETFSHADEHQAMKVIIDNA